MARFILFRLVYMVIVVIAVTLLVYTLSRISGDPRTIYLTAYTTEEEWEAWGEEMGLDKPLVVQYFIWMGKAIQGDMGTSVRDGRPVAQVIRERVPATLQLASGAFIFSVVVGIPLGVLSAVYRGRILDYFGRTFALLGQSVPAFWMGIMLILFLGVQLRWLPVSGRGGIDHFIMPSITLGWLTTASFLRLTRSSMLEVLDAEYVKFARAKGVRSWAIVWKHAFRNAVIPPLTMAGLQLATFMTGAVVTETVFGWPGLGRLAVQSVYNNDFATMTGVVMVFSLIYLVMNFFIDIVYALVDPRIRY